MDIQYGKIRSIYDELTYIQGRVSENYLREWFKNNTINSQQMIAKSGSNPILTEFKVSNIIAR
jgi:hypothetical protein